MRSALLFILLLPLAFTASAQVTKSLEEMLQQRAKKSDESLPEEKKKIMQEALEKLQNKNIAKIATKTGQPAPPFELPNHQEKTIALNSLLKKGPVVLTFYRGGWCPYCNLTLRALQRSLPEIREAGGQLVAVSPETPDHSLSTIEKNNLEFHVLSDQGNQVAKQFGLVYEVPEDLKELYLDFGIDLSKSNGNSDWTLPVSATYIINSDGKIVYHWIDIDYKKRAEPSELVAFLKKL